MSSIRAVTVYCSSSAKVAPHYFAAARELGRAIGREGWALVYGGNYVGLMGQVADGARDSGARVIGVTPKLFHDGGSTDPRCDEVIVTPGMKERKAVLEQRGDAFVALPGGIGTYEELFDVLVGKELGYHAKPIVLLDIDGHYQPFINMLRQGQSRGFVREKTLDHFHVAANVEAAIAHIRPQLGTAPASAASPASSAP